MGLKKAFPVESELLIILTLSVFFFVTHGYLAYRRDSVNTSLEVTGCVVDCDYPSADARKRLPITTQSIDEHRKIVNNFYEARKTWITSNLGTYLFKNNSDVFVRNQSKDFFNVLIWKHWPWLKNRHIYAFGQHKKDPLHGCSVSNCRFSGDTDFESADVVVVHLQKGVIPNVTNRSPSQLWIFWVDESPRNSFSLSKKQPSYEKLAGFFNWSMTYRHGTALMNVMKLPPVLKRTSVPRSIKYFIPARNLARTDSDVPIPYGRTIPLLQPKVNHVTDDKLKNLIPYWECKQANVIATILISNLCAKRLVFLSQLEKHINIDVYGGCATDEYKKNRCPGHFHSDCEVLSRYLFYIVMENSKCRQYLTEKSFHHAYGKGAIPVFVGSLLEDSYKLLPPNSFLHIDNFQTVEHLVQEIKAISRNVTKLLSYHAWRNHFEVKSEHGYFGTSSPQMCRICEALNYNQRSKKVYDLTQIRWFLDPEIQCNLDIPKYLSVSNKSYSCKD